jgi:hypothetical protein
LNFLEILAVVALIRNQSSRDVFRQMFFNSIVFSGSSFQSTRLLQISSHAFARRNSNRALSRLANQAANLPPLFWENLHSIATLNRTIQASPPSFSVCINLSQLITFSRGFFPLSGISGNGFFCTVAVLFTVLLPAAAAARLPSRTDPCTTPVSASRRSPDSRSLAGPGKLCPITKQFLSLQTNQSLFIFIFNLNAKNSKLSCFYCGDSYLLSLFDRRRRYDLKRQPVISAEY